MSHNLSRVSLSSESTSRYCKKVNVVVSDNERERKRERQPSFFFFSEGGRTIRDASATPYSFCTFDFRIFVEGCRVPF